MGVVSPYVWQEHDLDYIEQSGFVSLLNIEVGGSKTFLSLWSVARSGAEVVLVVAPDATHKTAWVPSVRKVLGLEARTIGRTGKARKEALADFEAGVPGIYLCTPEFLTRADISGWSGDFLIVDEVHVLSRAGAKGQRKLSGFTVKEHEESLAVRFPFRLALSGTPWRNNFERAWASARLLFPELDQRFEVAHANHWVWLQDRMVSEDIYTNQRNRDGSVKKAKKWLTEKEPGRFINELPSVVTHKRREECCFWHPNGFLEGAEPRVTTHVVPLHPRQKKAFKELEEQYLTWLGDNPLVVELPLTMQIRLRQLTLGLPVITFDEDGSEVVGFESDGVSPFTDFLVARLNELDVLSDPVVVWVDSQRFAAALVERLGSEGFSVFEWSGVTKKTRDKDLEGFGVGGRFQVMVATIASAGTGLDSLQRKSSTEFWLSESTDRTLNEQARGRLDRLGGKGQVDRHYLVDDLGYASGAMADRLVKELELRKTLRRSV